MSAKLRVAMITGSWPPIHCGVGDYTARLVHHLRQHEISVTVLTSDDATGANSFQSKMHDWTRRELSIVLNFLHEVQPDVIHMQYPSVMYKRHAFPNLLPKLVKKHFPTIPFVLTLHEYHDASRLGQLRSRLTLRGLDSLVLTNQADMNDLRAYEKLLKCSLIPIGSNIPIATQDRVKTQKLLQKYAVQNDQYWLNLGFVDPSKGLVRLIDAVQQSKSQLPLIIATEYSPANPYHREVMRLIKSADRPVVWTGFLDEVELSTLIRCSTSVVLPFDTPATERRGSVVAALAHGKAVITTGLISESPFSQSAALIADNTSSTIAAKLDQLADDLDYRHELEVAAQKAAKNYQWSTIAIKHKQLYTELIGT